MKKRKIYTKLYRKKLESVERKSFYISRKYLHVPHLGG